MDISKNHPRYASLVSRKKIVDAFESGMLAKAGLIAHGRGETFDYLFCEKTHDFAIDAIRAAASALLLAKNPVISVNGNVTALVCDEVVALSKEVPVTIEINLFYWTREHEDAIRLAFCGVDPKAKLLGNGTKPKIEGVCSNRAKANSKGIPNADLVLIPLEDGDRANALANAGKKTITVDLNPFSRTAVASDITIVDNIVRAFPLLVREVARLKETPSLIPDALVKFDNKANLRKAANYLKNRPYQFEEELTCIK